MSKSTRNQIKKKLAQISTVNFRLADESTEPKYEHIYRDIAYLAKYLSLLEKDSRK